MTTHRLPHRHDAHYPAVAATKAWRDFQAAMMKVAERSAAERAARDAQRERETTYARGQLGSS